MLKVSHRTQVVQLRSTIILRRQKPSRNHIKEQLPREKKLL